MQITSTFVLAALFALKASTVLSAPIASDDIVSIDARDGASYSEALLDARSFDDELEFDAREFSDELELDARDFEDYELFEARGRFDRKIGTEQGIISKEQQRIKAEQARLQNQQKDVSLQQQIHKDRQALRQDNFGKPVLPATAAHRPVSRFQSKMGAEQLIMNNEQKALKAQEQRLQTQQKDMSLQQQVHKDRMALRKDMTSFGRREFGTHKPLAVASRPHTVNKLPVSFRHQPAGTGIHGGAGHRLPGATRPVSRFQNKINSEDRTMHLEQEKISQEEKRLKQQQQTVGLQEQIHKDYSTLRSDKAF
ncbi:hypothetical protein HYPSUDRAFT_47623 [Hypholoma sublateritium FD-334 SS-4]|uniref:TPX2 C-terminal domain-containing protein n=1 Tax=Hypholoma sublateritium (strain FD-334 SS-4) TaxID=945553 RepID=A0A0D2NHW6_HYPSF|nr:hypothetical protein HYPSUDRAFT_47623 [Hypholoma sublateritium FD-334 SS-4]